jgi:hypothetical protein
MTALSELQDNSYVLPDSGDSLEKTADLGTAAAIVSLTPEEAEKTRQLKIVFVSFWALTELLRQGKGNRFVKVDGLPDDAMLCRFSEHFRFVQSQFALIFWSASFDVVPEANVMPELQLWCSLYQPKKEG